MSVHIHRVGPHKETYRQDHRSPRWCFLCRDIRVFEYVIMSPIDTTTWVFVGDFLSHVHIDDPDEHDSGHAYTVVVDWEPNYYGPIHHIECTTCHTVDGDCFPGTQREWSD